MTSNQRSRLTNLTRNFDACECKLISSDQYNGTKDNNDNKKYEKAVMLDEREAAYRSEDASNFFTFKTAVIIIPYICTMFLMDFQLNEFLLVLH